MNGADVEGGWHRALVRRFPASVAAFPGAMAYGDTKESALRKAPVNCASGARRHDGKRRGTAPASAGLFAA